MSEENPLQPVSDGRSIVTGQFIPGNQCAGERDPRKAASFRAKLFKAVSPSDFRQIIAALVERAKSGDMAAIKLCLQYLCGNAADVELHQRLLVLETVLTERG